MSASIKKDRKNLPSSSHSSYTEKLRKSSPSPTSSTKGTSRMTAPGVAKAQAEFLEDVRVSLREMKEGKVLPAEDALALIDLGLDDDELEGFLPK